MDFCSINQLNEPHDFCSLIGVGVSKRECGKCSFMWAEKEEKARRPGKVYRSRISSNNHVASPWSEMLCKLSLIGTKHGLVDSIHSLNKIASYASIIVFAG